MAVRKRKRPSPAVQPPKRSAWALYLGLPVMFIGSCGAAWLGFSDLRELIAGVGRGEPNLESSGSMVALVLMGMTMAAFVLALLVPDVFDPKRHPVLARLVGYGVAGGLLLGIASSLLADIALDEIMTRQGYRICSIRSYPKSRYTSWALTGHACQVDEHV